MEPKYSIKLDYNFEVYNEYSKFFYKYIQKMGRRKLIAAILFGGMTAFYLIRYFLSKNTSYLFIAFIPIIGYIFVVILLEVKKKVQVKKTWKSSKYIDKVINITQNLYENDFEQISEISTLKLNYDKFYAGYETSGYIYLMVSNNQSIIIDKSNCSDECIEFIRQKVKIKEVRMS